MRVLIAEDDTSCRKVLTLFLQKQGHEVLVTVDGEEAWEAMQLPDVPKLAILEMLTGQLHGSLMDETEAGARFGFSPR